MSEKLDEYDKKILGILQENSRLSASKIGKRVKLSKETVNNRIKNLLKQGYIQRFYCLLNPSKMGYDTYRVFFKLYKATGQTYQKIIRYLSKYPLTLHLRIIQGEYDIDLTILQKDIIGMNEFLSEFLSRFGAYIPKKMIHYVTKKHYLPIIKTKETQDISTFTLTHKEDKIIDNTDLILVRKLTFNARHRLLDLSSATNQEMNKIRYRLKRLISKGIIVKNTMALNATKFHFEKIELFICLSNPKKIPNVIEFFAKTQVCDYIYEVFGEFDLVVEMYLQSDIELRNILALFQEQFLEDYMHYSVNHVFLDKTLTAKLDIVKQH